MRYGLIAGNGRFPILALENARKLGHEVVAIGIREEASLEIEPLARGGIEKDIAVDRAGEARECPPAPLQKRRTTGHDRDSQH